MKYSLARRIKDWYNQPLTPAFMWWWFGITIALVVFLLGLSELV